MNGGTLTMSFIVVLISLPMAARSCGAADKPRPRPRPRAPACPAPVPNVVEKTVKTLACALGCHTACIFTLLPLCSPVCSVSCDLATSIGRRKKRSPAFTATNFEEISKDPRSHGSFASSLGVYDANKDGKISKDEFTKAATGGPRADSGTKKAFALSDKNGDKYIDCQEFKISPLKFDRKPTC